MKLYVDIEKQLDDFKLMARFETDGEVFAILGASGCGKTMTLRCIAGIERPDRGVIKLGDRVLFDSDAGIDVPARKRRIGYLFQDYAHLPSYDCFREHSLRMSFGGRHGNTLRVLSHRQRSIVSASAFRRREAEDGHSQDAGGLLTSSCLTSLSALWTAI